MQKQEPALVPRARSCGHLFEDVTSQPKRESQNTRHRILHFPLFYCCTQSSQKKKLHLSRLLSSRQKDHRAWQSKRQQLPGSGFLLLPGLFPQVHTRSSEFQPVPLFRFEVGIYLRRWQRQSLVHLVLWNMH